MRKAHLFKALYHVNQGIDDTVGGLERLNKNEDLKPAKLGKIRANFENYRSQVNLAFFDGLRMSEEKEVARLESPERRQPQTQEPEKAV